MNPIDPRENKNLTVTSRHTILRREVLAGSAAAGAMALIGRF